MKEFESTLTIYRAQIDNLESHLAAGTESIINQLPNSLERSVFSYNRIVYHEQI